MRINCPEKILKAIALLESNGYSAYAVGGCVRDSVMGRAPNDWDMTTSAAPDETREVFKDFRTVATGIKHGTVTVLIDSEPVEITTMRVDGKYSDNRHPESVSFTKRIEDDLSRRDFTVNAMAYNPQTGVVDPFGGQNDIKNKIIRCVGNPDTRFGEDALRMLRAYRFCAQLGFSMDAETGRAIAACAPLSARLSRERVCEETEKTLVSPKPEYVSRMAELGLLCTCGVTHCVNLSRLAALDAAPEVRWTAWKVLQPALDLKAFRLPARLCQQAGRVCATWQPQRDTLSWKRLIAAEGWEAAHLAARVAQSGAVDEIAASGACVTLPQLAVSGRDFPQLSGRAVGDMLQALLQHVLEHPQDNTRETLLKLAK